MSYGKEMTAVEGALMIGEFTIVELLFDQLQTAAALPKDVTSIADLLLKD